MEFSECRKSGGSAIWLSGADKCAVDTAVAEIDPHKRIAFVAAFAMSNYPKEDDPDQKYEHYTWKKVTTNVSGFILGLTTIDHYSEMTVSRIVVALYSALLS